MRTASIIACVALCFGLAAAPARAVQGDWLTDPDRALAVAAKTKTPILAVAMDHG